MTKTTKAVLSLAILGVGGYLLYKNFRKPSASFAGLSSSAAATVVGRRVQASGSKRNSLGGNVIKAQGSGWVRGQGNVMPNTGANGAPAGFFDTHSSGWIRG